MLYIVEKDQEKYIEGAESFGFS